MAYCILSRPCLSSQLSIDNEKERCFDFFFKELIGDIISSVVVLFLILISFSSSALFSLSFSSWPCLQILLNMAGVLRVSLNIQGQVQSPLLCSVCGLCTYARPFRKDAKPAEPIKGVPYKNLSVGVPKEVWNSERSNCYPSQERFHCYRAVIIKAGAGIEACFRNEDYAAAGGKLTDKNTTFQSDILLKVRQLLETEIGALKEYGNIISFLYPALNKPLVEKMA